MAYTSDDLLSIIKKRTFLPETQETFLDQDLLDMATDEMLSAIVPDVLGTREEWYLTSTSTSIDNNVSEVDIPSRAIGGSLREVQFSRSDTEIWDLPRLAIEDLVNFDIANGALRGFAVYGNQLRLFGSDSGSIVMYFHARPSRLIPTENCPRVESVDLVGNSITMDLSPEWVVGDVVDVIKSKPHFEYRNMSLTISAIAGNVITITEPLSEKIVAGDWVSLEDTSPAPQIPVEWFPYLAEAVAVQVFMSQGDTESAQAASAKMQRLRNSALKLMTPRVEGEARRLVPPKNRGSYIWSR